MPDGAAGVGGTVPSVLAGERWRWFGHPVFLAAVAVLAVNDHVLKARYGTWWTGKSSDVAGLVVVGMAAAAVLGVRRGLVVVGAAFSLLKIVPGVAEAAAPVLGGETLRDVTDLLALAVLLPLGWWLEHRRPAGAGPVVAPSGSTPTERRMPRATAAVAVVGATVAVFAGTATSCEPDDGVVQIVVDGSTVYAGIDRYRGPTSWARSGDGGRTWTRTDRPSVVPAEPAEPLTGPGQTPGYDPPLGPTRACLDDGTCFEVDPRERIRRIDPDGTEVEDLDLSRWELGVCGGVDGAFESIGIVELQGREVPIASLGDGGVVVRGADGQWQQYDVLDAGSPPKRIDRVPSVVGLAVNGLLVVAIGVIGAVRRWPSWVAGVAITGLIWLTMAGLFVLSFGSLVLPLAGVVIVTVLNAALGVIVGRSTLFDRRPPPPPGPWGPPDAWGLPAPPPPPPGGWRF